MVVCFNRLVCETLRDKMMNGPKCEAFECLNICYIINVLSSKCYRYELLEN